MPASFQVLFDGKPAADDFYDQLVSLEVEENSDLPGAVQLVLPVSASNNDLAYVSDDRMKPFANIAVVANDPSGAAECIFDGYVLTHRLHVERGSVNSKLEIWGQDASWLMNLEEKVNEWSDVTDTDVASSIFGQYGINPAGENTNDDSPTHTEDAHTLMQRATDIAFLRALARASGKLCRVTCADQPGQRTGYFARPKLDGDPTLTFDLNDPEKWNIGPLDLDWDVSRPTSVSAKQVLVGDGDGGVDVSDSGLPLLDSRKLSDFSGHTTSVLLAAPADSADELTLRSQGLLVDANWFARCEGESDLARLKTIPRVGQIVALQGVGSLHSGNYLVWSVRHSITPDSHKMKFVLVRNAVGQQPSAGGGLSSLLGGL
jgi:hypothetical protein